jgi:hypothetical protein
VRDTHSHYRPAKNRRMSPTRRSVASWAA